MAGFTCPFAVFYTQVNTVGGHVEEIRFDFDIIVRPLDTTVPAFDPAASIPGQVYISQRDIGSITLPTATGGDGALTYSITPTLSGLTLTGNVLTGEVSIAPTGPTTYTYIVNDSDTNTAATDTDTLTFTIEFIGQIGRFTPMFSSTANIPAQIYNEGVDIGAVTLPLGYGGTNNIQIYSITPALPDGLTLTGRILTGTPAAGTAQATTDYTYVVDDGDATVGGSDASTLPFTITIPADAPAIAEYNETVDEGAPIPGLATVVTPPAGVSPVYTYTITDRDTLPALIANSLVPTTGVFSRQFPCDQLDTGQTAYSFEWELRNSDGNLVAGAQTGALTLVNDPACVTSIIATLTGPLTEDDLLGTPAPTVTVELVATEYVDPLDTSHFTVNENIPGIVTISSVARTSATVAVLTLAYNNVDITAPGSISITVLAAGHTNSGNLRTNNLIITPRPGVNICGRTPQVRNAIVALSTDTDCTAVNDLATIPNLIVSGQGITALQSGDFAGMTLLNTLSLNNNQLTTLPADIFAGLPALVILRLAGNNLSSLDPATFAGLTMLGQLDLEQNPLTGLPAGIFNGLEALTILDLSSSQYEELPATVFDQLAMLNTIRLDDNPFTPATGLPAGIFDEILDTLTAAPSDPDVTGPFTVDDTVRAGHFVCSRDDADAVVAATAGVDDCLRITTTELNIFVQADALLSALTISAGVLTPAFDPATDAYTVAVQNTVASVTVTPTARQSGAITVQDATTTSGNPSAALMLTEGTPLAVEIIVTAPGGGTATYTVTVSRPADTSVAATLTGTLTETNLFAGDVDLTLALTGTRFENGVAPADFSLSDSIDGDLSIARVTILPSSSSATATVRLTHSGEDITAPGTVTMTLLASGHTGSDNLAAGSLTITISTGTNICGRTRLVRERIIALSTATECTSVTDLATMTEISLFGRLMTITTLQSGDFAGLDALGVLDLGNNNLESLPADIFNGLDMLTRLHLNRNQLTTLDANVFDGLNALRILLLASNPDLTPGTGLPAGIFDDVVDTLGPINIGGGGGFSIDQNVRNAHFICSRDDFDAIVAATTGATDCLRITSAQLAAFTNADASLRTLTTSAGDLRPAFDPEVTAYNVAVAANVESITVRPTANESVATITVNGDDVGSGFSSAPIALTAGAAVPITIVVTGGDGSAERTYTIMVTRGGAAAALAGTLTEVNLFSTTAPTVTVTLQRSAFVAAADLSGDDFTVGDTLAGTVSLSDVTRTSATEATLTLAYDNVDITANGTISITVLASGHTGSGDLLTNSLTVTASEGVNICGRTPRVRDAIVAVSSSSECTSITTLATTTGLFLNTLPIITELQSGDFAGMSGLTSLNLNGNNFGTLPPGIFDDLTALEDLSISNSQLTTLPSGIFDELDSLNTLRLDGNSFTAGTGLPAGVFDEILDTLTAAPGDSAPFVVDAAVRAAHFICSRDDADVIVAVTSGVDNCLRITTAQLTAFPMIDTTLSALTISDGNLVPAFDPLTDTYTVAVLTTEASVTVTPTANQGSDAAITVEGVTVASGSASGELALDAGDSLDIGIFVTAPDDMTASTYTVTVTRAESTTTAELAGTLTEANLFAGTAMATMTLTGTEFEAGVAAADFSLSDDVPGTVSVTGVTRDSVTGATLTLAYSGADITANGTVTVTMTLLASGHTGSGNLAAGSLAITASTGANVCGRTAEVRDAIVSVSSAPECTSVNLAGVEDLFLFNQDIDALQEGDFDGLTGLIRNLTLHDNSLTTLPANIFDDLNNVTRITLHSNQIATLDADIFAGLSRLDTLSLHGNSFTADTGLPAGIFDDVLDTLGAIVEITSASTAEEIAAAAGLVVDANARAAHFVCSRDNFAAIVTATTGVTDCLLISSAQLTAFTDVDASLSALTISAGELRPAFDPATTAYDVAVADSVATVTITPTANEDVATITVNGDDVDSGAASDAITLNSGTAEPVTVVVTAGDGSTERTYTVMVTRGGASAVLAVGTPLTEASLFGIASNRRAQVDLERTEFVGTADLTTDDFTVSDTLDGTVSLASVQRTGASRALLTLEHSGEDITANGDISITVLASGHTGSGDLVTNTIPITASAGDNICGRTPAVRDRIVAASSATECTSVTDLATLLDSGTDTLDLSGQTLTALQPGDFAGLTGLRNLDLDDNQLETLPDNIFAGLTSLVSLDLSNNRLASLPVDVFDDLGAVSGLRLNNNRLVSLDSEIFDGFDDTLFGLRLHNNLLESLPADIFAGIPNIVAGLTLNNNRLTELPATIFNGVTRGEARIVTLFNNPWTPGTGLPAGIFDGIVNGFTTTNEGILNGLAVDDAVRAAHFVCSLPDAALIVAAFPSTIPTATTEDHCPLVTSAQLDAFIQTDTSLSALGISAGTLVPGFDRAINAYTVAVQNSVASVTITPTANQGGAITVEGEDVNSGSASDPLLLTEGTPLVVDIEVTALDGSTTGAHTVTVTRAATGGASAALSGMITEANLFAGAAVATMMLMNTGFESGVAPADFGISDNIDGDLSIAAVTVAAGSTLTATIMLTHSGGDITTSGELSITLLDGGHTGSGNLPAGTLDVTASAGDYVCDRTAAVQAAIVTASANDNCTGITDLATITALDLSNRGITRLQDGDLDGLDALATLALAGNPFTAGGLPAGIFDGVLNTLGDVGTAFTVDNAVRQAHFICSRADGGAIVAATAGVTDCLRITEAQLSAFPAIDASLSALTLSVGDLMPSFDPATTNYNVGVGDVESVTVTPTANQSGATITVNNAPVTSGDASVAVTLTANMPETITIQVTATDTSTTRDYVVIVTREGASAALVVLTVLNEASLFSDTASFRQVALVLERTEFVPAADLSGDDFTVSDTVDGTVSLASVARTDATNVLLTLEYTGTDITANGGVSITVLASAHTGSGDLITNTQPIIASDGVNICGRTAQVRDAIVALPTTATECTSITNLDTITTINIVSQNIAALQSGDFAGLSGIGTLQLASNRLTSLPPGIFNGLSELETLGLGGNNIETLDADVFAGLSELETLDLSINRLTTLDAGIFNGLESLGILALAQNRFTPGTGLPPGIFDDVVDTLLGLASANIDANVRAAHFVCSLPVADLVVAAAVVDDCLRITTAQLAAFAMVDTSLSALTVSDGILTPVFDPAADTYTVAVQLGVTRVTITPTANQGGATITVAGTPVTSGGSIAVPASPAALTAGVGLDIAIEVTAPDTTTTDIYTVTATRGGPGMTPPRADVSGTITESDLFAGTAVVTMTLRETEFVAAADLMPDDFGLSDTVEGDLSIAGVTRDSTTAATIMLAHSGEDITAGELILDLLATGHTGSGTLPAGSVDVTASAGEYICGRTAAVQAAIVTASANDDCTNINDLATITALDLSNRGITRLQDGDLDGLDMLATLALAGNPFTAGGLPAGIFDDVVDTLGDVGTAFTVDNAVRQAHFICSRADGGAIVSVTAGVTDCLRITEAQLTAFPAIDASLRALTLSAGDLMPAFDPVTTAYNVGVAAGVESVTVTPTANQSGATITVNNAPVTSGSASVAVPLVANTPVPITIQVTATDTSTTRDYVVMVTRGGASAVLVDIGGVPVTEARLFSGIGQLQVFVNVERTEFVPSADLSGDDFIVTETIDGTVSVDAAGRTSATQALLTLRYTGDDITANGGISVTALASAHTGSGDLITNTLPITASTGANVCRRTPQVRDEITGNGRECTSITNLATITTFTILNRNIPSLQSGDFAGLSALTDINLNASSGFTTLPADIFAGLTTLEFLNFADARLDTLPPSVFAGLTSLDTLFLLRNNLPSLPAGIFDGLDSLENLALSGNPWTADTGLPPGIFDDVLDTVGPVTASGTSGLGVDDNLRNAHFICSRDDADLIVAATTDVDDCLRISSTQLATFQMIDTSLSALTISSGDALIPGFAPGVTAYTVGVLNSAVSITVTPTANQPDATITVQSATVGSGTPSAAIPLLTEGTPVDIVIVVTAPDTTTMQTITVTATREGAPTAELAGTVTEADLVAATAMATVTLTGTDYVEAGELMPDDFGVTDTLTDGTVSITEVARTSNRVATLTLGYDRVDIPDAGGRLSVTVLDTAHNDSGNLGAGGIDITVSTGTNVCGRTPQIRDRIVVLSSATECTSITDLDTIGNFALINQNIPALRSGDFAGMLGLTFLNLGNNRIATIDADTFAGLSALTNLFLDGNRLTALDAEVFDGLSALTNLGLRNNELSSLPADIFEGLDALFNLELIRNSFTPGTGLPAGIFDDIIDTVVDVRNGLLEVDDTVRAAHFVCSRDDFAAITTDAGVDDCLLVSSDQLNMFLASDATLSALTISDGVLSPPFDLATVAYTAAVQNIVASVTVTPTASQPMATITVEGTVVASGATSAAIMLPVATTPISIAVNSPDTSSTVTYTINVTRPAATGVPTAMLSGTLTEAGLFADTAMVTVTLTDTEFVEAGELMADDFAVTDTIDGTVSVTGVTRTSVTEASLALGYDDVDVVATDGSLEVAVRASGHTGAGNLAAGRLVISASDDTNVCGRTAQVEAGILATFTPAATDCTNVDLATIAGALDLSGAGITALQPGDFAGLAALTVLNLSGNMLATLPAGVFDDLAALTVLNLSGNALETLPADVLDTLTALQVLGLADNRLNALAATVFEDLVLLQELVLSGNRLSALDAGQFGGLVALRILDLSGNTLSVLATGQFGGLAALQTLDLSGNRLRALDAGQFGGLDALATLSLAGNTFTAGSGLPSGVFDDVLGTLGAIGAGPTGFIVDENVRAGHFICSRPEASLIVAGTSGVSDCLRVTAAQLAAFATRDSSLMALTLSDGALVPAFAPTLTSYSAGVADDVATVTVTPTANQAAATIAVGTTPVNSGEASAPITLTSGMPVLIEITVNAPAPSTATTTYGVTVTRGGATATLAGTVNEAALFATPTVTVTLARSEYVDAADLTAADFTLTDSIAGTVSIAGVARTSTTVATLTLAYDNVDITADGELFLTVLATGHTGSGNLSSPSLPIAQSSGANVCGRTAQVVAGIVAGSTATECTSVTATQLASITEISLTNRGITTLQSGDFSGLSGLTELELNRNGLMTLPEDIFDGLSALTILHLGANNLDTLDADIFDGLSALERLILSGNNFATLPADIFEGTAVIALFLTPNPLTPGTGLPAGIFDDILDTLGPVGSTNGLFFSTVPPDPTLRNAHFVCSRADFAAITTDAGATDCLLVTSAQLTAFIQADTVLSDLTISDGALSPAFDPATATYTVAVLNTVDEVTVTPTVRQSGATIAVQTVAVTSGSASAALPLVAGTPLAINIVVTARDGSTMGTYTVTVSRPMTGGATALLEGTLTEANLFAGAATATVTLMGTEYVSGLSADDFTLSADVPGTVSLSSVARTSTTVATLTLSHSGGDITANGELMVNLLASGHTGTAALATNGLVITASTGMNICGRTEAVQVAIVAVSTATDCTSVTDLATIATLDLSEVTVTTLQSGDFAGMTGLTSLNLSGDILNQANRLSALPADIFADLTALETLNLINNQLTTLDAGQFAGLSALETLILVQNRLTALPAGLFAGLTALQTLNLRDNRISTLGADQFDGLSALETLILNDNQLEELPAGLFDGLTALDVLDLEDNSLTALPANIFNGLTALRFLVLRSNLLTELPAALFDGLTTLDSLQLNNNALTTLPAGLFNGVTALALLNLDSNPITSLPAGLFDGTALTGLSLRFNMFTPGTGLPAGIFDGVLDTLGGIGTTFEVDDTVRDAHFVCSRDDANAVVAATDDVDDCLRITEMQLTAFASTDAGLSELTISDGDLVPAFDPAITDYTVAVANDVEMVTVTPTVRQTSATIMVNNVAVNSGEASGAIALMLNTAADVPVVVTATDGSTVRTYTIMVTRGGATATLRAVNSLTEQGLFAGQINFRAVRVDLERTEFVDAADLTGADFTVSDTLDGTVSLASDVRRDSDTLAFLVLEYSGEDITDDGTLFVTVLESAHTRSGDLLTNTVPVTASAGANVCGRTPAVVAEIEDVSVASECTNITDLATITELDLSNMMIATLQSGDFAGLTGLTNLSLQTNRLTALPTDLFTGLTALVNLRLQSNQLTELDADQFDGLTALALLGLNANQFTALPADLFNGLTELATLTLGGNNLLATLPADLFDGLDALTLLDLQSSSFTPGTGLPAGIFDDVIDALFINPPATDNLLAAHFVCSLDDADAVVAATTGVTECLRITSAQLDAFIATDTSLSALTISDGVLIPAFDPGTDAYNVAVLGSIESVTVTPTTNQPGATVAVQTVTVPSGSASGAIMLTAGTPLAIDIVVTAPDGMTMETYTLTVSRPATGGATAMLAGTLTEAGLFAATVMPPAPTVTVTLTDTAYDFGVTAADFELSDDVAGTVRLADVTRNSATVATLRLSHSGEDIAANGILMMTLLASGHTGTVRLATNGLAITASAGENICDRTAEVVTAIVASSADSDCTNVGDLATITTVNLTNMGVTMLESGDFAGLTGLTSLSLANNGLSALPVDIFDGLAALDNLALLGNSFTVDTGLPAGVFDDVLDTLDGIATSGASGFVVDDNVRGAHFVCSRVDADDIVTATSGVSDCLRITAAQFNAVVGNVTLSALTISEGALVPPTFAPATTAYAVTVANSVANVTVTPTAASSFSTITVDGTPVVSGMASTAIALTEGATLDVVIVVTAADGTTRAYTVAVTRLPAGATATLSSTTLTEANLFADTAMVTVTVVGTEFVGASVLMADDFMLTDTVTGR